MNKENLYYGGIQLEDNTITIVIIDDRGKEILRQSFTNEMAVILAAIEGFSSRLQGFAVHAKANQNAVVKGLIKAGYRVFMADLTLSKKCFNLPAKKDLDDAGFFAFILRLMTKCKFGKPSNRQNPGYANQVLPKRNDFPHAARTRQSAI